MSKKPTITKKELEEIYKFSKGNSFEKTCELFLEDVSKYRDRILYYIRYHTKVDIWKCYELGYESYEDIINLPDFRFCIQLSKYDSKMVSLKDVEITKYTDPYEISKFIRSCKLNEENILEEGIEDYKEEHFVTDDEEEECEDLTEIETETETGSGSGTVSESESESESSQNGNGSIKKIKIEKQ